jgi:light-regulated signal transduction histidine kinase (bacteriophytochrome)
LLPGRRFGLFVADEARLFFSEFLKNVFASQVKKTCEIMLTCERNLPIFVQIEAVAFASGQESRIAVIDITERKRAEESIKRLHNDMTERAAELETANLELEAFNYTVAHDLRGPLNVISSSCQVLKELCGDCLNEQCRRYIRNTCDGTLRMSRQIEALLDFSRPGHVEPKREMISLSDLAHEISTELRQAESERQVDFLIADGIVVNGDANLLRVVLENLLGNAWKYTGMKEQAVIEFGATEIDGEPIYFVRDNGVGFDNSDVDRIFIPFQRLSGAEEFKGFGIGLATVERIIRRYGGRVCAEGEPGKGASFYFTLPT